MKIHFLNHASIIVEYADIKLLTDPWFFGSVFEEGWGLRYDNQEALSKAEDCTHLWVSHFHQDHYHIPTLKKILEINPNITVIGNKSYNFQLNNALSKVGFRNIIPFEERKKLELAKDFVIIRYPTTGIDNMLLITTPESVILNYNDCSLPSMSQKRIKKEIGEIDILLTNYNHAGKLLLYPFPNPKTIKSKLVSCFSDNYKIFNPKYILPFASHHYYRAKESFQQNDSMIAGEDLANLDNRIVPWKIGQYVEFSKLTTNELVLNTENETYLNRIEVFIHNISYKMEELVQNGNLFVKKLKNHYGPFAYLLPDINIKVSDLDKTIVLSTIKGCFESKTVEPHIISHSESLHKWFTKIYGTDSFVVGAHFEIVSKNKLPLMWRIVLGILIDNKLDLKSVLIMLFTKEGLKFLLNRREEIIGILFSGRIAAEYHKD